MRRILILTLLLCACAEGKPVYVVDSAVDSAVEDAGKVHYVDSGINADVSTEVDSSDSSPKPGCESDIGGCWKPFEYEYYGENHLVSGSHMMELERIDCGLYSEVLTGPFHVFENRGCERREYLLKLEDDLVIMREMLYDAGCEEVKSSHMRMFVVDSVLYRVIFPDDCLCDPEILKYRRVGCR